MEIKELINVMAALRDPDSGCPWDLKQNFKTVAPYTIEEAYEVLDAIEQEDFTELKGELGDLLFQIIFHSRLAEEQGLFDFSNVVETIVEKMIRRHPHVFDGHVYEDEKAFKQAWEADKHKDKKEKHSVLDGVPNAFPSLKLAQKIQKKAASVGFDWTDVAPVYDKIEEETEEIKEAVQQNESHERIADEVGDLLFAVVNLSRHLNVDAEDALRKASNKFRRRFQQVELKVEEDKADMAEMPLEKLEMYWQQVKTDEK